MVDICNYSIALKQKQALPFEKYNCISCTQNSHIYMYLEFIYENKIKTKDVFKYLNSPHSKIRHSALLYIVNFFGPKEIPAFMLKDPFYKIRKLCINQLNQEELIFYLDDVNDEIILGVLEILYERYCEFKELYEKDFISDISKTIDIPPVDFNLKVDLKILCKKLTGFMTHSNKHIRSTNSKLISIFYKLDPPSFHNLLFKHIESDISGTIVYGLEDECSQVRKNTIISLFIFYKTVISKMTIKSDKKTKKRKKAKVKMANKIKELVNIAVEYFINTINDEDEEVRNTAIYLFHDLTIFTKFRLSDDLIMQISYNIIENTKLNNVDFPLMGIFRNIRYKSVDILLIIINKFMNKLDTKYLVNTLYEIFKSNIDIVHTHLYKYSHLAEQEQELINKDFVVKILINFVCNEQKGSKVNKTIKKYFNFIEILLKKSDRLSIMKESLISMIKYEKYSNVFNSKGLQEDTFLFMNLLYKGMVRRNLNGILKLNEKFENPNLTREILLDEKKFVDFIQNINMNIVKRNK